LLLPGKTDSTLAFYASHSYYHELLSAGVKIYERQDALLHAKTALIDGVWSTVGSTNLDWLSFLHNQEINAVILGPEFSAQMRAIFDRDIELSTLISLEQWRRRPLAMRIKEFASRLWARWI
jgi:cardiolipin synthase A/B